MLKTWGQTKNHIVWNCVDKAPIKQKSSILPMTNPCANTTWKTWLWGSRPIQRLRVRWIYMHAQAYGSWALLYKMNETRRHQDRRRHIIFLDFVANTYPRRRINHCTNRFPTPCFHRSLTEGHACLSSVKSLPWIYVSLGSLFSLTQDATKRVMSAYSVRMTTTYVYKGERRIHYRQGPARIAYRKGCLSLHMK
jgi:hypothetical protein